MSAEPPEYFLWRLFLRSFAGTIVTPPSDVTVSRQVTGLQTAATYCWKVVASDGNGGVTASDVSTLARSKK